MATFTNKVTGTQTAIEGDSTDGRGVSGTSNTGSGLTGQSQTGRGVEGWSTASYGVSGDSQKFAGVRGTSVDASGTEGWSTNGSGVFGISQSAQGVGVDGHCDAGVGVRGMSRQGRGMQGTSDSWQGVYGLSQSNAGVVGESPKFHGVYGVSHDPNNAGVFGTNDGAGFGVSGFSPNGIGVSGKGGKLAGRFEGDVEVWGDIRFTNADCAEDFPVDAGESVEPGTVMVLSERGALRPSSVAYDKRVAGVVSGAGDYRPAIVLDRRADAGIRHPIALVGKVYCKVDARCQPVSVGDLLTTSDQPGCAMKAADSSRAFGAVIGKALRPLAGCCGLIPILVALQ